MVLYVTIYWLNLILAFAVMITTWFLAVNEIRTGKRFWMVLLTFCCAIEVTILCFYIPSTPPTDLGARLVQAGVRPEAAEGYGMYLVNVFTTLLLAKLVLKPGLVGIAVYNLVDMRRKIRKSEPHGQKATAIPQSKEQVHRNQVASVKGKVSQAVETATEEGVKPETIHKIADSQIRETNKS